MKNIDSLKIHDLKELLIGLKTYRDMKRKLGMRGTYLFKNTINSKSRFLVEHFTSVSEDLAYEKAQTVYKKSFGVEPKREDIDFNQVSYIGGGIKVYVDDNMVDMSYSKIKKALKN